MAWDGNPISEWELVVYSDADLAGDQITSKSTTGVFVCIRASHTFVPLQGISQKQRCVSKSTPEAELVAADVAIRTEALPALELWETLTKRKLSVRFMEDNSAAVTVMTTGRNPTMRHLARTHRLNIAFMHECCENGHIKVEHCPTVLQCADIFTKSMTCPAKWKHAV
jgi:hypothetical protein